MTCTSCSEGPRLERIESGIDTINHRMIGDNGEGMIQTQTRHDEQIRSLVRWRGRQWVVLLAAAVAIFGAIGSVGAAVWIARLGINGW